VAPLPGGRSSLPDPRRDAFAAREPYFAVLTDPKFLRAHLTPSTEREFHEGGETLVEAMFRTIELRVAPHFAPTSVLEYGCGVGRLALPLAGRAGRRAGQLTAVDRSPALLEVARREAKRYGVGNVTFQTPAEFFAVDATFDFVNCYFVFQRIAPSDGIDLLRHLVGRIRSGGIGAFQFPYRVTASPLVRTSRSLRERVPGVNPLVNLLRGKPADEPFAACHAYDTDDVLQVLGEAGIANAHLVLEPHAGLASALLLVEMPLSRAAARGEHIEACPDSLRASLQPSGSLAPGLVDTPALGAETSLEDLNRAADQYFATLRDWEHHLAKPFANAEDTPQLLTDVAIMLQGLKLRPGLTVVEFGAGTGWLSRFLTQLGCRAILLDVSPAALRIAEALYARVPVVGDRPAPQFLPFDGRRIALPDASVDRIVCLHAFHHVPNPDDVIAELGRVLRPGGIAGFAEPGPQHSRSAQSQFEMRTYGVVERDVDVHAIWKTARANGFADLKLAVFHALPFHVTLEDYEDLLAGGPTGATWLTSTRVFLRNVRSFFLIKGGAIPADSHSAEGLACEIHVEAQPDTCVEGVPIQVSVRITNTGKARWLPADSAHGGVGIGVHLYEASGALLSFDFHRGALTDPPREIAPGETVPCALKIPELRAGRYVLELDCVSAQVMWFSQAGSRVARVEIDVG